MKSHRLKAVIIFIIVIVVLIPTINALGQHGDEKQYVWKANYYAHRLIHLDFSPGSDLIIDPGFDPASYWARSETYGSHLIYAIAMGITNSPPPELPYFYTIDSLQGQATNIPPATLFITRLAGALCSAMGLALFTLRFGWAGLITSIFLIALPSTRDSFSRAWSEGPLMLGFGICSVTYKTRWFPVALGSAVAFKLTALGLWPMMFLPGSCGREFPWRRTLSIIIAPIVVSILTPVSWFFAGPLYLGVIIFDRVKTWFSQSQMQPTSGGIFFPARYAWPFELLAFLLIVNSVILLVKTYAGFSVNKNFQLSTLGHKFLSRIKPIK